MTNEPSVVLVLAGITFILTVIWGNPLIRILRWLRVGDSIRLEMPNRHVSKVGTPTMGGVMFIVPVILVTGLMNAVTLLGLKPAGRSILMPLGVLVLFALLGAVDDREKLRRKEVGEGIRARYKILIQLVITAVIAYGLYAVLDVPHLYFPGFEWEINLGWFYIPVAVFIILGSVNAINFTDGMDGLAGLIAATAFAAYGGIAILQEQIFLAQFCFTLVGALFGFLWFNVHPAQLIMGDTGSEALGASLGVVALMTGHWLLLPIIAIIPVSEVLSVIIQVAYFKLTGGKRIFKMSPLHMHFELSGWSEMQIVQRFWLVSLLFTMVGVALAVA
jgi:phospho-N-acetylmuramoyl-pentapeptide-transferase